MLHSLTLPHRHRGSTSAGDRPQHPERARSESTDTGSLD